MAKDKKAAAAKDKKAAKNKKNVKGATATNGTGTKLKRLAENPLVADVVAAALVATASALKDSKKAHALAASASDEIEKLSKSNARDGSALWGMALDIGRSALESFASGSNGGGKAAKPASKGKGDGKKRKPAKTAAASKSR